MAAVWARPATWSSGRCRGLATSAACGSVTKKRERISVPSMYWLPASFVQTACGAYTGFETASKPQAALGNQIRFDARPIPGRNLHRFQLVLAHDAATHARHLAFGDRLPLARELES